MAEAALAMRDVMSREEEPSFVIKDLRYVKESTNTTSLLQIFNGRWLVGLGVIAMSFVFGQLICIPTRLASSCKIVRASCSTHADGAKMDPLSLERQDVKKRRRMVIMPQIFHTSIRSLQLRQEAN